VRPSPARTRRTEIQDKQRRQLLAVLVRREFGGKVFCLVDAPSKEAAEAVHRESHGSSLTRSPEVKEGA